MKLSTLLPILIILVLGGCCLGQERSRQSFRRRRPVEVVEAEEEQEPEQEVVEEEEEPATRRLRGGRPRARAQAFLDEDPEPVRPRARLRGRGRASEGGRSVGRGAGFKGRGQRPRARGMARGRRPQVRLPNYDYYDYYYDQYYEDQFYYDDYYPEENLPPLRNKKKKTGPFANVEPQVPVDSAPSLAAVLGGGIGGGDSPGDIIKKLWIDYIKEQEQGGGSRRKEPEEEYECPPREQSYFEPDEEQCDKYFECNIKGEIKEHLCPDGFVFDITLEKCDYPVKVNCSTRPLLQEPQPSTNCSRANGFFPWPANISCQNFWDCREGTAYQQTCPVGVIFDPNLNTCATPDQSTRQECKEGESSYLGFNCPEYTPDSVLRFGNHDRLPHPTDCQQYFSCLITGGPRLATCPRKKVFNNATGHCSDPKEVPGCEKYWEEKLKDTESDYYYADYY